MNHKLVKLVLIVQLLLFAASSFSQSLTSSFIVKTYTTQDGLPHSGVFSSMQDSRGYLWVGTFGGICRFDGREFFNYTDNDEVKNLVVSCTYEDNTGRIWMYSGWSLYYMDNKNIYPFRNGDSISLNLVYRNGDMKKFEWWGKSKQEIFRIGGNGLKNIPPPAGLGDGYCRRIVETNKGYYYSDPTGLFFVAKNGKKTSIEEFIPHTDFVVIMGYWDQKLYFYNKNGVFVYNDSGVIPLFQKQLNGKRIYTSFRDSKKRIWVSTIEDGVLVSKPNDEEQLEYKIDLPNRWVKNFYEDKEGNTWIAFGEGLTKVTDVYYEYFLKNKYSFLWDINYLGNDLQGNILLFSETNGLIRRQDNSFLYASNNPFRGKLIDELSFDDKKRMWCLTRGNQLFVYDGEKMHNFSSALINHPEDLENEIAFDQYRKLIWVLGNQLLIGDDKGFEQFIGKNNKIISNPKLILPLADGKVIVSTETSQLFLIEKNNEIRDLNIPGGIATGMVNRIFSDSEGSIWMCCLGIGLLQFKVADTGLVLLRRITRKNGLNNTSIHYMAFDKGHHLWLATEAGITIIDFANKIDRNNISLYQLGVEDGLPKSGVGYSRLVCDDAGNMWYSTQYALLRFLTNDMKFNSPPPAINIENVMLDMQQTNWGKYTDSLSGIFQIPFTPIFKYYQNTITIDFKAVSMYGNGDFQYSYLLKGLNENWSSTSTNENITLTKLPPGSYTFMVKARKTSSTWSEPASFSFAIRPAIWQQWWFNPLLVLAFFGIIYWVYRFRITQIRKEEKIRRRLASDLHDDIGSTLSSISYYSEAIRKQVKDSKPDVISLLDKMEAASDNTVDAMSDIVWATNPSFDKGVDLLSRMRLYAADVCDLKNVKLEFEADPEFENTKLNMDTRRNIFLVFKKR